MFFDLEQQGDSFHNLLTLTATLYREPIVISPSRSRQKDSALSVRSQEPLRGCLCPEVLHLSLVSMGAGGGRSEVMNKEWVLKGLRENSQMMANYLVQRLRSEQAEGISGGGGPPSGRNLVTWGGKFHARESVHKARDARWDRTMLQKCTKCRDLFGEK